MFNKNNNFVIFLQVTEEKIVEAEAESHEEKGGMEEEKTLSI